MPLNSELWERNGNNFRKNVLNFGRNNNYWGRNAAKFGKNNLCWGSYGDYWGTIPRMNNAELRGPA